MVNLVRIKNLKSAFIKIKWCSFFILLLLIFIDQYIKIFVKTHFYYGQEKKLLNDWLIIHFVENDGLAIGRKYIGDFGKVILTTIKMMYIIFVIFFYCYLLKNKYSYKIICLTVFILAGSISNTLDNVFYAAIFTEKFNQNEKKFIYNKHIEKELLLFGNDVDVFYLKKINQFYYPHWLPFVSNNKFHLFDFVFNLADIYIFVGLVILILNFPKIVTIIYTLRLKWLYE